MPTEKYAPAHRRSSSTASASAATSTSTPTRCSRPRSTPPTWDDDASRWQVTTTRGDRLSARFLVTAGGILHKAKLPAIEGINDFAGRAFHTTRWDYGYTGGSPTEPMDELADKRVGIIGTGATVDPGRAAAGPVRRRRCSSSSARRRRSACAPTPPPTSSGSRACSRAGRTSGCVNFTSGRHRRASPSATWCGDGWTEVLWEDTQTEPATPEEAAGARAVRLRDHGVAARAGSTRSIDDPETAETLKPWYGKHCKRICFHDEYLQAFNQPNVHLVDTDGRGVQQITAAGPVVDGRQYELDLLIFASGFEVTTGLVSRLGFDPVGRGGVRLSERWADGAHTLHGILTGRVPQPAGVPLHPGRVRARTSCTTCRELTEHLAWLIATCERGGHRVDRGDAPRPRTSGWRPLWEAGEGFGRYSATCTPSYGNSEGARTEAAARNVVHPGSLMHYVAHLERWRESGDMPGTIVRRSAEASSAHSP